MFFKHHNVLIFLRQKTSWWQPRCPTVPPLKDLNRVQVAVPGEKTRLSWMDGKDSRGKPAVFLKPRITSWYGKKNYVNLWNAPRNWITVLERFQLVSRILYILCDHQQYFWYYTCRINTLLASFQVAGIRYIHSTHLYWVSFNKTNMRLYAPQWKYEMLHYTTPSRDTASAPMGGPSGLVRFYSKKKNPTGGNWKLNLYTPWN